MLDLGEVNGFLVDGRVKGLPPSQTPTRLADIASHKWNVLRGDVPFPVAVIRQQVLQHNSAWMQKFVQANDISLCPHGKTTMAPHLFDLQLRDGAWGLTAANATHVAVYRSFGVSRIILANQLMDRTAVEYISNELRTHTDFDFYCLIESHANLKLLLELLKAKPIGRPLQLLLELGMPGGRTGMRTTAAALELAVAIKAAEPLVSLRGIEAFEGIVPVISESGRSQVSTLIDNMEALARACDEQALFGHGEIILTAGGSAHFDEVTRRFKAFQLSRKSRIVLRSGCYLTHDVGFYGPAYNYMKQRSKVIQEIDGDLEPALEVWARVQSVPEPGLAFATLGKRDISHDVILPSISRICRSGSGMAVEVTEPLGEVTALNDQHAFIRITEGQSLEVGDLIAFGISHPCTTFDKWQVLYLVDEQFTITGAIKTYF